ncbi:MAG: mandelate racemase/muconate lactonizing enzyme family protein, partial [Chloroflexota bacterium]|nr:mandelate racemase/muconate lactonizing enzyme family protein [Chloroflexota bacterium]
MKVTGLRQTSYAFTMGRPLGDANGPIGNDHGRGSILYVDTDAGLTGIALGGGPSVRKLEPLVVGEDPRGVVGLWQRMMDFVFKGGNEGADKAAIGAIDVALWDLKAKINGEPLWRTLGAREGRVKAYASGIDLCLTDDEIAAFYGRMAARGVDAGKLKVGLDPDDDLRRLQIMKDQLLRAGKRPHLMIDSNEYWSPKQAIRAISEIERHFDLTWVEEPARRWDYRGLRQVSRAVRAAVATGENLNDASDFYPLLLNQAVDIVQVGAGTTGITGAMQVAHMAAGFQLPVAMMNCPGDFMAHLAAALPNHSMMEVVDPGREPCFTSDARLEAGFIHLGETPGLGLTVDETALAALAEPLPLPQGSP